MPDRPPVPPSQSIAADLRERIEAGEWASGQQLPTVAQLAEHYGHTRRTVSRALKTLADEGLVRSVRSWGTFRT